MSDKFDFSDHQWSIRTCDALQGPGPNLFAANNVLVDEKGLHLLIQQTDGVWSCGEVILDTSLGYGRYSVTVSSDVAGFDPNIVFGFFVWSNDPAHAHREIDLEIAKWGKPDMANGQFVVQPHHLPGRKARFVVTSRKEYEFSFLWKPGHVIGYSRHGTSLFQHQFSRGVPPTKDETIRMNLWLFKGEPPTDGKPVEIVVSSFRFSPYMPLWDRFWHLGEHVWHILWHG